MYGVGTGIIIPVENLIVLDIVNNFCYDAIQAVPETTDTVYTTQFFI